MSDIRPVGYEWFFRTMDVRPLRWQQPCVLVRTAREASKPVQGYKPVFAGTAFERYDQLTPADHLILAIMYEPLDMYSLTKIFRQITDEERATLKNAIVINASSEHSRRLGYLYERLSGDTIDIPAAQKNNIRKARAASLLDSSAYITLAAGEDSKQTKAYSKWRIVDNSLGEIGKFSPIIRRTAEADNSSTARFAAYMDEVPSNIRAMIADGLYDADIGASFRIEGEVMSRSEARRLKFAQALKRIIADRNFRIDELGLTGLQNIVCEGTPSNMAAGYRKQQNAIGCKAGAPSYLCPPPNLVPQLMESLSVMHDRVKGISPLAAAAAISGSFVFIHPFMDGNGRLSRALMHKVMGNDMTNYILPISIAIEHNRAEYIRALADVTGPVMSRTAFTIKDNFYNITKPDYDLYRYPDLTRFAGFINDMASLTIDKYVPTEVSAIAAENILRKAIPASIKSPDRLARILAVSMAANNGQISKSKRKMIMRYMSQEQADAIIKQVSDNWNHETINER